MTSHLNESLPLLRDTGCSAREKHDKPQHDAFKTSLAETAIPPIRTASQVNWLNLCLVLQGKAERASKLKSQNVQACCSVSNTAELTLQKPAKQVIWLGAKLGHTPALQVPVLGTKFLRKANNERFMEDRSRRGKRLQENEVEHKQKA